MSAGPHGRYDLDGGVYQYVLTGNGVEGGTICLCSAVWPVMLAGEDCILQLSSPGI